jgi:hypothetical protein
MDELRERTSGVESPAHISSVSVTSVSLFGRSSQETLRLFLPIHVPLGANALGAAVARRGPMAIAADGVEAPYNMETFPSLASATSACSASAARVAMLSHDIDRSFCLLIGGVVRGLPELRLA